MAILMLANMINLLVIDFKEILPLNYLNDFVDIMDRLLFWSTESNC